MRRVLALVIGMVALALAAPAWASAPGLEAAYSFDEGSGSVLNDASGNGHNGTINGATWTSGRYGGGLSFNGSGASVDLGALGTFYQGGFTLEAWVQKQTSTKNDVAIVGTFAGGGGPMLWVDHLATRYHLTMNSGISNYLDSGRNPTAGQWQHLAATFDPATTTARFYIDGTEVANRSVSVGIGSSNAWRIGAYGGSPGGFFDGLIDDVRIYNRALTSGEITTDMNQPIGFVDPTIPTTPGTFTVTGTSQTSISVQWSPSTDDVGVTGYRLYRNGASVATTAGTSYTFDGLACGTSHALAVEAFDASNNVSPRAQQSASTSLCDAPTGAVAAYSFDEGSGSVLNDASGNGHNGTINGATWTSGRYGGGLSFNGSGASVDLGALGTFYQGGFTLEAWVQKQTSTKNDVAIVGTFAGGGGPMLWVDHLATRYHLTMNSGISNYLDSGRNPTAGQWQHLAATFDPATTTARFYIDGTEVANRSVSVGIGSSNAWRIGAYGGSPGGFFDGLIDDVRIYNRALTSGEITTDMNQPVSGGGPPPPDGTAPSAPATLVAIGSVGQATLSWGAATDNVGVAGYNVHRATSAGFTPTAANRIAQPTGTSYTDNGLAAGTYYYKVTAEDAAGNVGPASNEAGATVTPPGDATPPSAPGTLTATGATGKATLGWGAASDNVGVARYNVHRATSAGFTPTAANRIAQPTGTSYTDNGLAAGTYYYKVTAEDATGNVGPTSNEASASVATDTTAPTVSVTAPTSGSTATGIVTVTASASDAVGVAGVQFRIDSQNLGAEDTVAPYSIDWDSRGELNGSHTLRAIARDAAGNTRTSSAITVTVNNAGVSQTGLQVAYGFDDGSGTVALDASGSARNGTLVGATWSTAGRFGGAVSLSGQSSEVDPPALGTFYKTGFTYEAWVLKQSSKVDVGLLGTFVSGGPMLWVDHLAGRYRLTLGASFADYLDSGRTPAVGQWQHVAATYDGTVARIYIDGAQTASTTFTGNVGNSNTWRIGAYGSPAGNFFDGLVDNVRIYDRALTASEIQLDMVSRIQPEGIPPTVTTKTPANGATGVNIGGPATVSFSEAMAASTITTSTFLLKDASGASVPSKVTYSSSTKVATLTPTSALQYGAGYTLTVKGGSSGVKDLAGNPLAADLTWSFETEASPPQVLVVGSTSNPYGMYLTEILRNEGLNEFTTVDVAFLSPALLSQFDVVILGDTAVNATQISTLTGWVNAGGNLIAMRPDKQLASLLGLTSAGGTTSNAYLKVDTTAEPGTGIVGSTIQYHGASDRYTLNGATAVATLYSNASTATPYAAVTLRSVGTSGGQAAAFTYDLARSVVYTRQGNPAWAGQERDGVLGLRPDDMFYGAKAGNVQPDWINTSKIAIPQADEQQRLLVNMITTMARDKMPLPRFWYLPRGERAVVVLSGDDHSPTSSEGRTASNFDHFKSLSPPGCSVAAWECVRASSYIYPESTLTPAQAHAYAAEGFEIALHPNFAGACPPAPTANELEALFDMQLSQFRTRYPDLPSPATSRTHCVEWPDWASEAKIEAARGIRLDGNYYHYPGSWIGNKPGFMNGGGFPMRFADLDGTPIDAYQQHTHMHDEAGQTYPFTTDTLLDNAIGPNGFYGAFGTNIHHDFGGPQAANIAIINAAQSRGVPLISYKQLLTWVDGRNNSTIRGLNWSAGTFTFTTSVADGANGLQTLLPTQGPAGMTLSALTCSGSSTPFTSETIKGVTYARFDTTTGTCQATYS